MTFTRNMTTAEAAEFLGISVAALRSRNANGTGPRPIRFGRAIRYNRDHLQRYKAHLAATRCEVETAHSPTDALDTLLRAGNWQAFTEFEVQAALFCSLMSRGWVVRGEYPFKDHEGRRRRADIVLWAGSELLALEIKKTGVQCSERQKQAYRFGELFCSLLVVSGAAHAVRVRNVLAAFDSGGLENELRKHGAQQLCAWARSERGHQLAQASQANRRTREQKIA